MQYNHPKLSKIYIDKLSIDSTITKNILKNIQIFDTYKNTIVEFVDSYKDILNKYQGKFENVHEAKDILLIHPFQGRFIHACPGSDGMACCNYFVINFGLNCSFDCSYCYLQTYLNTPILTIFSNVDDLLDEVKTKVSKHPNMKWRIGTGEYTDSLALDHLTELNKMIVPFFSQFENVSVELKSKSNNIQNLLGLQHNGKTLVSWTINTKLISENVEKLTSTVHERLLAAQCLAEQGYQIAFHIDPIVWYENWEQDYQTLIDELFEIVPKDSIHLISLGTFRHSPGLKQILRKRNQTKLLLQGEMLPSSDGKSRYFAPQRAEMYIKVKKMIESKGASKVTTYLCMETKDMWQQVYGFIPKNPSEIEQIIEHGVPV